MFKGIVVRCDSFVLYERAHAHAQPTESTHMHAGPGL